MASKEKVSVHNTLTDAYSEVPRFVFEHPVYGQYMELVEPVDMPCNCPEPDPEPEIVPEVDIATETDVVEEEEN